MIVAAVAVGWALYIVHRLVKPEPPQPVVKSDDRPAGWARRQCPLCKHWVTGIVPPGHEVATHTCLSPDEEYWRDKAPVMLYTMSAPDTAEVATTVTPKRSHTRKPTPPRSV